MAFALHPLAVQNVPLLRELGQLGAAPTIAEIARRITRDESNVRKSIKALMAAGLAMEPMCLTVEGAAQLAAIDRAEGRVTDDEPGSPAPIAGVLALAHAQILPDPENARRDWDSDEAQDELDALRQDIIQNGLLQNLVVRPAEPLAGGVEIVNGAGEAPNQALALYTLVGGERRWRAIGAAIFDGDWPEDRLIPCRLLETDDLGHRLAALAENLQRRNLNPIEKAKAFEGLADAGLSNKEIADRVSSTPEHVQQHRRFLQLDEADQQRMTLAKDDPRHLSVREARQKLAAKAAKDEAVITLEPMARLAWIELTHAALCKNHAWSEIIVAPDAADTLEGAQLANIGAVEFRPMKVHGELAGRFTAKRGWSANNIVLDRPLPAELDDPEQRDGALRREQAAALGVNPPPALNGAPIYATPWLANPGELTPEGVEARDQEQARLEAMDRQREADRSASVERERLWAEARQRHLRLLAVAQERPEAGQPEEVAGIAHDIDRPLPWTVLPNATIVAANGTTVKAIDHYGQPNDRDLALAQMIAVAANAAGGMVTPKPAEEAEEPPLTEEAFISEMAVALGGDPDIDDSWHTEKAAEILTGFLDDNTIAFGDDGFAWDAEAARLLVEENLAADEAEDDDAQDEAA